MAKQGGYGVVCKIGEMPAAITSIMNVSFPEQEKIIWESTAHDSSSGYVEWLATGLRQLNEFSMTLAWDSNEATHAAILTAFTSDSPVIMSIEDPAGQEVITFSAHVTKIMRVAELKGGYTAEISVQPTGAPTIT